MITDDELYELTLRIQSENETEGAKILLRALREYYEKGFRDCEKIALKHMKQLGADLITNVFKSKLP